MDQAERLFNAFLTLKDTSFGTLWWVVNTLWMQEKTFVLKEGSKTNSHPGVAITDSIGTESVTVPMLLGTSRTLPHRSAIPLKLDDQKETLSYFGAMKPVPFSYFYFLDGSIRENTPKYRLSDSDQARLKQFIRQRLIQKGGLSS